MSGDFHARQSSLALLDILRLRAEIQPDKTAYIFLVDGETEETKLTYRELDRQAGAVAAGLLKDNRVKPGDRALLLYPPGMDFIPAFFGCLYAGVIAAPCYPPNPAKLEISVQKLRGVIADCDPEIILTTREFLDLAAFIFPRYPDLEKLNWMVSDEIDLSLASSRRLPKISEDTPALLQYTSGSTGEPKGVIVSHANLIHNNEIIARAFGHTERSVGVGWLPMYHDMGLIGHIIQTIWLGGSCVLMSPVAFLEKPIRWLRAVSKYKAATSGGPNFAYDLCAGKATPEDISALDLSSWEVAFSGAEPVRLDTFERFAKTFEPSGFNPKAFYPCYGLAEATLAVSGGLRGDAPIVETVDKRALRKNKLIFCEAGRENAQAIVGCGKSWKSQKMLIVDPETKIKLPDSRVGEIWLSGPSVAQGYWSRPRLTKETFQARLSDSGEGNFLRTGDLGFVKDGELFVTGRLKDIIIVRGRNYYPQDIELTAERSHPDLRPGCSAAFSFEKDNKEQLAVAAEVKTEEVEAENIIEAIRQAISESHQLKVYAVTLLKPRSILKTSSGKIQRRACRQAFLEGKLSALAKSEPEEAPRKNKITAKPQSLIAREILNATEKLVRVSFLKLYLRELAAKVLSVEPLRIDAEKPVSSLGLDSVGAVEMKVEVEEELGLAIDLGDLIGGQTIVELAEEINRKLIAPKKTPSSPPVAAVAEQSEYPLSPGQRGLYFEWRLNPKSSVYNIGFALRIKSEIKVQALKDSLDYLADRHAQLRAVFIRRGEELAQRIVPASEGRLEVSEIAELGEKEFKEKVKRLRDRPFDLEKGPPSRFNLFKRSEKDYVLSLAFHHIVSDGWSLWNFLEELKTVYSAKSKNEKPDLSTLEISHADYVAWEEKFVSGEREEKLERFWMKKLSGEIPRLNLPSERPRPAGRTLNGAVYGFEMSPELTNQLKKLAAKENVTLYTLLLAAYQILLGRCSGQDKVATICLASGRSKKEFLDVAGYFVNPLVLTADLSGNSSFRNFLSETRRELAEALRHQEYPFVKLTEKLRAKAGEAYSDLARASFALHAPRKFSELADLAAGKRINWAGLETEIFDLPQQEGLRDLQLEMLETTRSLSAELKYSSDLFDRDAIKRLAGHFTTLLEGIVSNPDGQISRLPLLRESEKRRIMVEWNASEADYPKDKLIHQFFEEQAEKTPDNIALAFDGRRLSYADLNSQANQLARCLRSLGVGPETPVPICAESSAEMIIGLLAILKAGGACAPLDPAYPRKRLAYMMNDLQAPVLLTQSRLLDIFPDSRAKFVCLDSDQDLIARESRENIVGEVAPDDMAYVIYTSGSTGKPKGVAVEHKNLVYSTWARFSYYKEAVSSFLLLSSFAFDSSIAGIFWTLSQGGLLVLPPEDSRRDVLKISELIAQHRVSHILSVPSLLNLILRETDHQRLDCLRVVVAAGETCSRELVELHDRALPKASLFNEYGPTEATVWSSALNLRFSKLQRSVSIGRPIPGAWIYILDRDLQPTPIGVAGELHIGGPGLARGYLGRPRLTGEKFIPDPFGKSGSRLYKTGDLGRYLPDGNIEFIGRADHQVKIQGLRIELGEIEAALRSLPQAKEAAALIREDQPGDKRLTAYIATEPGKELSDAETRNFLKLRLPSGMIPAAFVFLDALPLTPNGKIDRKALPSPILKKDSAEPRNVAEKAVATIWADALKMERVGISDNFFEIGGHSLAAIQIAARIQKTFRIELTPATLLENQTVEELSELIVAKQNEGTTDSFEWPDITPDKTDLFKPFDLTDIQRAYWVGRQNLHALGNVATHAYGEADFLNLDPDRLEVALNQVIRRHDMLRAVIAKTGRQRILEQTPFYKIEYQDLRDLTYKERGEILKRERDNLSHQILDSSIWPLFCFKLFRLPDRHRLCGSLDALIFDAASFQIFSRELGKLYLNSDCLLPEINVSFRDYVMASGKLRDSERRREDELYWINRIDDLPLGPRLPLDKDPASIKQPKFKRSAQTIDSNIWGKIKAKARKLRISEASALLTLYAKTLSKWSLTSDFMINLTIFNRLPLHEEVHRILGDFTSVELLEFKGSRLNNQSLAEQATAVFNLLMEDLSHSLFTGVDVQREMMRRRGDSSNIVAPVVMTSLLDTDMSLFDSRMMEESRCLGVGHSITQTSQVWIDFKVYEQDGNLRVEWDYVDELFPDKMADEMRRSFCRLLEIAADLDWTKGETPNFLSPDIEKLALASNDTDALISDEYLHTLFSEQATKNPDRTAIISPDVRLTYRELFRVANRIGRGLRRLGLRPGDLAGVAMNKSWRQVVAALGILNAGAAYLPISAEFPEERVRQLLELGEIKVVLTQPDMAENFKWPENIACRVVARDCFADEKENFLEPVQKLTDPAYVIFTSGSTGVPKGVMINHRQAVNTILDVNSRFQVNEQDKILGISELWFDLSVYDIFGALAAGASLVLPGHNESLDLRRLARLVEHEGVTIWNSTPAFARMFYERVRGRKSADYESLRLFMLSGDWIPLGLPGELRDFLPEAEIVSMGGATEGSIWSIIYPIDKTDPNWKSVPYGKALRNQKVYVLDENLEYCPTHAIGEIYIGGEGVAMGYWKDRGKTAAAFISNPKRNERLYKTGDLGRLLPDGNIELIGRNDDQIKIRGYRVEPGEIEATLRELPGVKDIVVSAVGNNMEDKRLAAYLVLDKNRSQKSDYTDPRSFLKTKLPDYMTPSSFVFLEALPLTPNGKIDRKALPVPASASTFKNKFEAPRDATEEIVAKIWGDALKTDRIGIFDNFFDLGGSSFLVIYIVGRLEKTFKIELPPRVLYDNPNIAELSESLRKRDSQPGRIEAIARLRAKIDKMSSEEVKRAIH